MTQGLDFQDPLFGILILVGIVFLVGMSNLIAFSLINHRRKKRLSKIMASFYHQKNPNHLGEMLDQAQMPLEFFVAIIEFLYKKGDFQKAIDLSMATLKHTHNLQNTHTILKTLAKTYGQMGFMQRAIDLFHEALQINPSDGEVLEHLIALHCKTKNYSAAEDAIESYGVLGNDTTLHHKLINSFKTHHTLIAADPQTALAKLDPRIITKELLAIKDYATLNALIAYPSYPMNDCLDVFYNHSNTDQIKSDHTAFKVIKALKHNQRPQMPSGVFALDALVALQNHTTAHQGYLSFTYTCQACKHTIMNDAMLCPNCLRPLQIKANAIIKEGSYDENNQSLH